jgi:hypothetical protein
VEDLEDVRYVMAVLKEVRGQGAGSSNKLSACASWQLQPALRQTRTIGRASASGSTSASARGGASATTRLPAAAPALRAPSLLQAFQIRTPVTRSICAAQVRDKEADIDGLIGPIEEMYALLGRYEVSMWRWRWWRGRPAAAGQALGQGHP